MLLSVASEEPSVPNEEGTFEHEEASGGGRRPPRLSPPDLFRVARRGTWSEFLTVYDSSLATGLDGSTASLLHHALRNTPERRESIGNRLLDDGADASVVSGAGATTAHVLLGHTRYGVGTDARLLRRLLDGGSEINRGLGRFGVPVFTMARQLRHSEEDLAPLYEVLLTREDLDPLAINRPGVTLLDAVRALGERRRLLADALATLHDDAA